MKKVRFIDLFAGIGGMRLGLEKACSELNIDYKCVFSSEIDKYARQTYEANFSVAHKVNHDINNIKPNQVPDHNILLAGFPCQPFSQAGLRKGFDDTRGTLFHNIKEILKEKRPRMFLLENFSGLVTHNKWETLSTIITILENELGYHVKHKILNSKDFGVPQNRRRIFFYGTKIKKDFDKFNFPEPIKNNSTKVSDILEKNI